MKPQIDDGPVRGCTKAMKLGAWIQTIPTSHTNPFPARSTRLCLVKWGCSAGYRCRPGSRLLGLADVGRLQKKRRGLYANAIGHGGGPPDLIQDAVERTDRLETLDLCLD